jgi:hypothetical protein
MSRADLAAFVEGNVARASEAQAIAVLENRHCSSEICQVVAQNPRLTAFYSVRLRLVGHRATPLTHAVKFVHYLHWPDMVRLSVDVRVPAAVRRALDKQLLGRMPKLAVGERVSVARRCSREVVQALIFDLDPRVFEALLTNQRSREEDLVYFASSHRATKEKLILLAADRKWSHRYAVRKALVLNPLTPRATAASQLRYLSRADREAIRDRDDTSVYLRRCIENL